MNKAIPDIQRSPNGITVSNGEHALRITFITDGIVRVQHSFSGDFKADDSHAVLLCTQAPDPQQFGSDEKRIVAAVQPAIEQTPDALTLSHDGMRVRIEISNWSLSVTDALGNVIHRDLPGRAYVRDENLRTTHYFTLDDVRQFYGFGEKTGALNKYKRRMRMYSCDTMGYDPVYADPLYKHIPFFIKRGSGGKYAAGVFYDAPGEGVFDMGCEFSGYWKPYAYFQLNSGALDYYVIAGPQIRDVVRRYTDLTGKTALPPLYSLGYMASTMYLTELERDCDKAIEGFVAELDHQRIPCDGFHLSSGYTTVNGKRCVFQWNHQRFPSPGGFAKAMRKKRIALSPNVKPALLTTHPLYGEFAGAGALIMDTKTDKPYLERFWGGEGSFVDFSVENGRTMWKKHMTRQILENGITDIWNDNNEFEFTRQSAVCGGPKPAHALKPVFANLMAKTAREALAEYNAAIRPYILSRAGYAGIQRYAQTWAGDNVTSWDSLKYNIPTMLGMGLSGVANQGCDIGGFHGPAPDAELFVRWVQNGVLQPRFCIHSCNTDNTVTQPWSYGEPYTSYVRDAITLRYRLGMYLYALMRQASVQGDPVMRAMVYEFQQDERCAENNFDFMLGPYLLAANVLERGARQRSVYLPAGCDWYDFSTHQKYTGGQTVTVDAPLDRIPLFYRSGTILPLIRPALRMGVENFEDVELLIEPQGDPRFTLYQDDGVSNAYQEGSYRAASVSVSNSHQEVWIRLSQQGHFPNAIRRMQLRLAGRFEGPMAVTLNGQPLPRLVDHSRYDACEAGWHFDMNARHVLMRLPAPSDDCTVHIDYRIHDLVGMQDE